MVLEHKIYLVYLWLWFTRTLNPPNGQFFGPHFILKRLNNISALLTNEQNMAFITKMKNQTNSGFEEENKFDYSIRKSINFVNVGSPSCGKTLRCDEAQRLAARAAQVKFWAACYCRKGCFLHAAEYCHSTAPNTLKCVILCWGGGEYRWHS